MKRLTSSLVSIAAVSLVSCLSSAPSLKAASINFAGTESGAAVERWSDTSVSKSQDLNGDNRFGGTGYYQITPGAVGDTWSQEATPGNDLGLTQEYPTQAKMPAFLNAGPVGAEGTYLNLPSSPDFRNPQGNAWLRQGSLWLSNDFQTSGTVPGGAFGFRISAFTFTLSAPATFRLGVAVDTLGAIYNVYAPDRVSVFNTGTGEVFSTQLSRDGTPDMAFFNISGSLGDTFEVALWQTDGNIGIGDRTAFALITFDKAPTPTLTCTQNEGSVTLSWEQNIAGWILESSTDLGAGDDWDPVPGVVNNSVNVSMTGAPKNFFRLRKNP